MTTPDKNPLPGDPALASAFSPGTHEQWRTLVGKVLKGASFERALTAKTYDSITVQPLYPKAAGDKPRALRGAAAPWRIAQRVDHPDPGKANELALADLEGGADELALVLQDAPSARGFGVPPSSFDQALAGVMLDLVHLRVEPPRFGGLQTAEKLATWLEQVGIRREKLSTELCCDPIGNVAQAGSAPQPIERLIADAVLGARRLSDVAATSSALMADGRVIHEAGGSEAQELAFVLATAVAYLRALEADGLRLESARDAISFLLTVDANQFLSIGKMRALRQLWHRIEGACGLEPRPIRLGAETAWRMMTTRDPWVNMLRTTVAAFAAGVGGADTVTVLPFTSALGLPDGFARRMARNTQLILLEEASLWRVADPAAGSGGLEEITEQLAVRAWSSFQAIEKAGGIVAALRSGTLQDEVARVRAARQKAIAHRHDAITGTSEFPHVAEGDVSVLMRASARSPNVSLGVPGALPTALPSERDAEPYERLRDRADKIMRETSTRPRVFLANLGPVAAFTARAAFAKNFFEAGGIEALGNDGFADLGALIEAFSVCGTPRACICSSDEIYAIELADTARALLQAGASCVHVAGRPQKLHEYLRQTESIRYIYAGCDVVATLSKALDTA